METLSRSDLIKTIERYQHNIQLVNPPENDAQRVLHYIRKLSKLPIKLEELEKTGIGKTINALRKCKGTIGDESALLVGKWKAIAKRQVQEEEESEASCQRNTDSHSDYESPDSDYKSSVPKPKKIKVEVQKPQLEKNIKEIKLKAHKELSDRKRKHSNDKDRSERKEKYTKVDQIVSPDNEPSKPVKIEDRHHNNDKKKKKDKPDDEKIIKKDNDKKHHKSSKHKEDRNHRHHSSKSSHTDKKRADNKSDSEKHRERGVDKKKELKIKHENDGKSSSSRKDSKSSKHSSNEASVSRTRSDSDSDNYGDLQPKRESSHTDDDFGAALLGISQAVSPVKKKSTNSKTYSSIHSSPATNSPFNSGSEFDMLSNSVKLEPLDDIDLEKLKDDTSSSREGSIREKSALRLREISEEEALNSMTTTKNQRTKVFSGGKSRINVKFPSLFELCVRILQENFDALEYTGGVPYDVLKPILEKVSVEQLYTFENYNPYLIGETDELWEYHSKRHFRHAKRQELETWRDVYLRCVEEREEKLQSLTENISQSIANSTPQRKTKLAYFDTIVKPPRNVARSQAKHGTGNILVKKSPKGPQPSPAAVQSVKERLAKESMAAPQAVSLPSKNLLVKKKKAPLMQKTLQLFKGLKR